jgi:dTDP-4-dehydrorhamnose reductase
LLDLAADDLDVAPLLAAEGVTAIINCGAYTSVDQAEDNADLAQRVNGEAPGTLARAAAAAGIPIVQISTDYVFSGEKLHPYDEDDETGPNCVYGRSKLAGERAVAASGARHAIIRTAWIFSPGGKNFVRTMLRLGAEGKAIRVVADQHGSPTHAADLAHTIAEVTMALEDGGIDSGTWHAANDGETTWHGLARHIFERAAEHGRPPPEFTAVTTAEYPTEARRPANSRLNTAKLQRDFGITMRTWQQAVDDAVDTIISQEELNKV